MMIIKDLQNFIFLEDDPITTRVKLKNLGGMTSKFENYKSLNFGELLNPHHYVRSAITAGFVKLGIISGTQIATDVLTKSLPYTSFCPIMQPISFWKGNTDV